jgi:hypothetical protein
MFEIALSKRGRKKWEWRVLDPSGKVVVGGFEGARREAKYKAERAFFHSLLVTSKLRLQPKRPLDFWTGSGTGA